MKGSAVAAQRHPVWQETTEENASVGEDWHFLECVAALVLKDATVLAEERKPTKRVVPGAVALPGGHVEPGEGIEERSGVNSWRSWESRLSKYGTSVPLSIDQQSSGGFATSRSRNGKARWRTTRLPPCGGCR